MKDLMAEAASPLNWIGSRYIGAAHEKDQEMGVREKPFGV